MGRMIPMECEHGVTVDWGDFGPCQNCDEHPDEDCPNFEQCEQCEDAHTKVGARAVALLKSIRRLQACHRSGAQIDVGPATLEYANELYTWLVDGQIVRRERAARQEAANPPAPGGTP